jgi:hypothetical protein
MKQGIPSRRTRGRGNNNRGRQQNNVRNQQMDSNGPAGRLRGTPQQIFDRYSALARDASSSGDMVLAENLWQHAEHYARLLNLSAPPQQQNAHQSSRYGNGRDDSYDGDDQDSGPDEADIEVRQQPRQPVLQSVVPDSQSVVPDLQEASPEPSPEKAGSESDNSDWSPADVQAATDEVQQQPEPDQRPSPPRRRRRTRFQRQQDSEQAAGGSDSNGVENASPNPGTDSAGSADALTLPADRSPGALIDLLTRAENSGRNGSADPDDDRRAD